MRMKQRRRLVAGLSALLATSLATAACGGERQTEQTDEQAAEAPDRVSLVVPFSAGGGTDTLARVLGPALEDTVEGDPSVEVVNRPGGESITGTNQFVNEAPDDGSQLLVSSATTSFQWLLDVPQVEYDFTNLKPLLVAGTGGVIYASAESGIESVQDLADPPESLHYGGISATGLDLITLLAFDVLRLQPEVTFGFEGRGPARLALQRGETNIDYQTTPAYLTQVQPLVEEGQAVPLMTFGTLNEQGEVVRDPNFEDLPTVPEVYEQLHGSPPSGESYEAYVAFLAAGFSYQKALWATPETPQPVRQAFVDAVPKLQDSQEFNEQRTSVLGNYPLYAGDEVQDALAQAYGISDGVKQYVFDLLESKYDTEVQ